MKAWGVVTGGVLLAVRVSPRGGRNAVEGLVAGGDGKPLIGVRIASADLGGPANDAVEAVLARWLGVPPGDVEVTSGASVRAKEVTVDGDPVALCRKLQALTVAKVPA